jgi:hypothetical protein
MKNQSVAEQARTYDRRTSTQRKRKGLDLIAGMAMEPANAGSVQK